MQAGLRLKGIETRLAVAPTLGCAWACSRHAPQNSTIIEGGREQSKKALAPLPITALRISAKTTQALQELNITKIEHLINLPPKALRTRFDRELVLRLNQALGIEQETILAVPFVSSLRVGRNFEGAITQLEALQQSAQLLLTQLLLQVADQSLKISRLIIELKTVEAPTLCKEIPLSLPSREQSHLSKLLKTHIERLSMGAGVESIALHVPATQHIESHGTAFIASAKQDSFQSKDPYQDSELAKLVDSLYEQLGEHNVLQVAPTESHIPEKSISYVSLVERMRNGQRHSQPRGSASQRLVQADRPSMLFYQPREIRAMAVLPDTPPFWLKWQQQTHQIRSGIGPERIAPEWWGNSNQLFETRDYFKVQIPNGLWLWIFRDLTSSKWFLHGIWA